jgi:hypothetical protein
MAITLIVNNTPFDYPENGEPAGWGEAATGWAQEVTTVLNSAVGPNDLLETSSIINDNQLTFADIDSFFFDATVVGSFVVNGNITRGSLYEEFQLRGLNTGSSWTWTQEGQGEAGLTFNITNAGQVQYKSTNAGVSGKIRFKGIAILKSV